MNKETNAALEDAAVKDKLAKQVMDITPMSVEQAKAYVTSEVSRWGSIVKRAGIEPQ